MFLIIILGLIAKLVLVCDGCDIGNKSVTNFDWFQYSGPRPWYYRLHSPNDFENNYDCLVVYYFLPEGSMSLIKGQVYDISEQRHVTIYGNATNWNRTGFEKMFPQPIIWNGRYYVIATDYDSYQILKHCVVGSDQLYVYVGYRSKNPDGKTVIEVLQKLKDNNIDVSQLVDWPVKSCP